jgi:hypothetical protein
VPLLLSTRQRQNDVTVRNDLCDLPDAAVAFLLQYGPAMAGPERDEQAGYVPSFASQSRAELFMTRS